MNWISNFVRPKIRSNGGKNETPNHLWMQCSNCEKMVFQEEFLRCLRVCPHCNYHARLSPSERFAQLFDEGVYTLLEIPLPAKDPLGFKDLKTYKDRLSEARKGVVRDAVLVGEGSIEGSGCVVACFDFSFMGGSMGLGVGDALVSAAQRAVAQKLPLLVITASGGARMQEGILSLMQMPRSVAALELVRAVRLPYLVLLTDPTSGGVTASFAMLGDITLAESGAMICFTGPRVIQETLRTTLPEGFQRAEYLLEHGMVDRVVPRSQLRGEVGRVLRLLAK